MSATALHTACDELLVAASEACAMAPGGAMSRLYVAPGAPAWDCPDQLTVHVGQAAEADTMPLQPPLQPMQRISEGRHLNLVTMTITALRCAPILDGDGQTPLLPLPEDIEQAAMLTNGDLWSIWNHLATRKRNLTLFPPREREFIFDTALAIPTMGGIAGWQVQVRVQVDGYSTAVTP